MNVEIKKKIISIYSVFLLIFLGFTGILVFDGIVDECGVEAATLIVGPGQTYTKIQTAINAATAGDTIRVYAGTFKETLYVNKRLTLIGNGSANTVIDGGGVTNVISIQTNRVNIRDFKIMNASSTGPGIYMNGISNCVISDNNFTGNFHCIYMISSTSNTFSDNLVYSNYWGVYLHTSNSNTISGNIIKSHSMDGLVLYNSDDNIIMNNICNSNTDDGLQMALSTGNTFINNTFNSNGDEGLYLTSSSDSNTFKNNTCKFNTNYGFYLSTSSKNTLINNTCQSNGFDGINLYDSSNRNRLTKNTCISNIDDGINLYFSCNYNTIENNKCNSNFDKGIVLSDSCNNNMISNNTCNSNSDDAFFLNSSSKNIVNNNTCNLNVNKGIICRTSSNGNTISNNTFSNNGCGIRLWSSSNNHLFFNNILTNTQQADDDSTNYWNNSHQEGNYWSDYSGLDNGAGGRTAGDGIGDTNIPHPGAGYDYYPFIKSYGWMTPEIPTLLDPGETDIDGDYTISWNTSRRATKYILEEDVSNSFTSPTELYNGSGLSFDLTSKPNGTYYYRLKANRDTLESKWSNIVDIVVDLPPTPPTQLIAHDPTGHNISLTWNASPEADIEGYHIFINDTDSGIIGPYHWIKTVSKSSTSYKVTDLLEETKYYFVMMAYDSILSNSTYSNAASATTLDETPPLAPTGLEANAISGTKISLNWNASPELDLTGYIVYMNETSTGSSGPFKVIHTITGSDTTYTITNLVEKTTYYFRVRAFDEVPNNSSFSNLASAFTPDETSPSVPQGLTVSNATNNSLTVSWYPNHELDVVGYNLSRSMTMDGTFSEINTELLTNNQFIDTGLEELTTYYYKVRAIDDVNLKSGLSMVAFGTTLMGQCPPEINNSISDFEIPEDCCDDSSINLFHWFKDVNGDNLMFKCSGEKHIDITIFEGNGTVILRPEPDWNGKETITFYAADETLNETSDSVTITVSPINDPPHTTIITKPRNQAKVEHGTKLNFDATSQDPDIVYGDKLTFTWSSDISGVIAIGESFGDIVLSIGYHKITLVVSDTEGATSTASIYLTVEETNTTDTDGDGIPNMWEREHGLNPTDPNDATKDPDIDGLNNYEEYLNNTDPQEKNVIPDDKDKDKDKDLEEERTDRSTSIPTLWIMIIIILIIFIVVIIIGFSLYIRKKKREFERPSVSEPIYEEPVIEPGPVISTPAEVQDTGLGTPQPEVIQSAPMPIAPSSEPGVYETPEDLPVEYVEPSEPEAYVTPEEPEEYIEPEEPEVYVEPEVPEVPEVPLAPEEEAEVYVEAEEPEPYEAESGFAGIEPVIESEPPEQQPELVSADQPVQYEQVPSKEDEVVEPPEPDKGMEYTIQEQLEMLDEQLLLGEVSEDEYYERKSKLELKRG